MNSKRSTKLWTCDLHYMLINSMMGIFYMIYISELLCCRAYILFSSPAHKELDSYNKNSSVYVWTNLYLLLIKSNNTDHFMDLVSWLFVLIFFRGKNSWHRSPCVCASDGSKRFHDFLDFDRNWVKANSSLLRTRFPC